jgi:hypothetical protein
MNAIVPIQSASDALVEVASPRRSSDPCITIRLEDFDALINQEVKRHLDSLRKRLATDILSAVQASDQNGYEEIPPTAGAAANAIFLPNYCRRKGECWAIRFAGNEERIYTPEMGFYHLQILLEHPGISFSSAELDCAVGRKTKGEIHASVSSADDYDEEGVGILGQSDAGPQLDVKAIQSYRLRVQELNAELEMARNNNDLGKIEKLEEEKGWISSELTNAHGLGGRIRKLNDDRNRVRNRVCNAIQRALKKIRQHDKTLFEHLHRPVLNLGHSISYTPRTDLSWSTVPTSKT